MASSDSQISKPQRGCPKRAELPDVNINIGTVMNKIETLKQTRETVVYWALSEVLQVCKFIPSHYLQKGA